MFTEIILPIFIMVIMFGMGLTLNAKDFSRLFFMPKPIIIGLICQLIGLPLLGFIICIAFDLPPVICVGVMIIASCPGGAFSNVVSQLIKANLSLSISLTGLSTIIGVISTPLIIELSNRYFLASELTEFSMLGTSLGILLISVVPVLFGIFLNEKNTDLAQKISPYFEKLSTVLVVIMIVGVLNQQSGVTIVEIERLVASLLSLNISAILLGSGLALYWGLSKQDALTLGIESGIQNASLAIVISLTMLGNSEFAATAIVYGLCTISLTLMMFACKKIAGHKVLVLQ
ncbi:bile acid:sodium symporter family protein [Thalassotalea psychrophila]|uniref:Bile acid:sodium symporter family protein n=1 Tax=Thalassotalea psychrophila TaxID=3065647 RepID=A0ABY9TNP6_9GAMM|nr:bile acid:sodium symporter family protein [Colwelliaceae bacterium SQ149]